MGRKKSEPTKLIRIKVSDAQRLEAYCKRYKKTMGQAIRRLRIKK